MTFVMGIILGIITGLGLALLITSCLVKDSNDIGDSVGRLENFGRLNIMHEKMRRSKKGCEKDIAATYPTTILQRSYDAAIQQAENEETRRREALTRQREDQKAHRDQRIAKMMGAAMPKSEEPVAQPAVQPELPPVPEIDDMEYIDFSELAELLASEKKDDPNPQN